MTPVTTPVNEPMLAAEVLLSHDPPGTMSPNVAVAPTHRDGAPDIGPGEGLTVTTFVARQPVGKVYVMVVVPVVIPVIIPVIAPIVAVVGVLLNHVPPPGSVSVIVALAHNADGPVMANGRGLTAIVVVIRQPVPAV